MQLLLVEDNLEVCGFIGAAVAAAGWDLRSVHNCADGVAAAAASALDIIILDRNLPDGDGLEVMRTLRAMDVMTPVLVLSALSGATQRIEGLQKGADDYLGKPFATDELLARLVALQRRSSPTPQPEVIAVADVIVWRKWRAATRGGQRLDLTDAEYRLLLLLAEQSGKVVTRSAILREVLGWKASVEPGTPVVEVAINRLRQKLDRPFPTSLLRTVRGRGYLLAAPQPSDA
jgi:two-component system OmpR family response regulator